VRFVADEVALKYIYLLVSSSFHLTAPFRWGISLTEQHIITASIFEFEASSLAGYTVRKLVRTVKKIITNAWNVELHYTFGYSAFLSDNNQDVAVQI
jgi:hypothetical protein